MKIFYAVQATGNGHISRAHELFPYLREFGTVDFLLSGSNSTLQPDFPVKYRSQGLSLFYSQSGGLNRTRTLRNARFLSVINYANSLPLETYDLIINDFDFVTAYACWRRNLRSVQFGHQASFQSFNTPRPASKSVVGEIILKYYGMASHYVGLHFRPYDNYIFPPVIKQSIRHAQPADHGHITIYLPAHRHHGIKRILKEISPVKVHWFLPGITSITHEDNITFFPIRQDTFDESLIYCHGIVTGGGFETPAEALYLHKKLLCIPIADQYEQQCNAAALALLGIRILKDLNEDTKSVFFDWVTGPRTEIEMPANDIDQTLSYLLNSVA
ncbi:MAG: glycosyl transferase [Saprospiraceae bacterium]|nr:glycosyl transferase [Candidatus Opimibacter iunctus]